MTPNVISIIPNVIQLHRIAPLRQKIPCRWLRMSYSDSRYDLDYSEFRFYYSECHLGTPSNIRMPSNVSSMAPNDIQTTPKVISMIPNVISVIPNVIQIHQIASIRLQIPCRWLWMSYSDSEYDLDDSEFHLYYSECNLGTPNNNQMPSNMNSMAPNDIQTTSTVI